MNKHLMSNNLSYSDVRVGALMADGNPTYLCTSNGGFLRRHSTIESLLALQLYLAESLGDVIDPVTTRAGIENFLVSPHLGHCVVAWGESDRILAQLEVKKIFDTWENAPYWYIDNYVVFPEYQRLGIGAQMLEYVKIMAENDRVGRIRLFVSTRNVGAKRFYTRHGFGTVGDFMELPMHDGLPRAIESVITGIPEHHGVTA